MDGRGNLYDSSCVMESRHAAGTSGVWMIEEICMTARVSWSQDMLLERVVCGWSGKFA